MGELTLIHLVLEDGVHSVLIDTLAPNSLWMIKMSCVLAWHCNNGFLLWKDDCMHRKNLIKLYVLLAIRITPTIIHINGDFFQKYINKKLESTNCIQKLLSLESSPSMLVTEAVEHEDILSITEQGQVDIIKKIVNRISYDDKLSID